MRKIYLSEDMPSALERSPDSFKRSQQWKIFSSCITKAVPLHVFITPEASISLSLLLPFSLPSLPSSLFYSFYLQVEWLFFCPPFLSGMKHVGSNGSLADWIIQQTSIQNCIIPPFSLLSKVFFLFFPNPSFLHFSFFPPFSIFFVLTFIYQKRLHLLVLHYVLF